MNKTALAYVLSAALSASVIPTLAAEKETPASLLAAVNTSDGINKSEAERIAKAYFLHHVGCGAFDHISEAKDTWVVEGTFGIAGQRIEGFHMHKRSGAIKSPVGPSYGRPEDLLR